MTATQQREGSPARWTGATAGGTGGTSPGGAVTTRRVVLQVLAAALAVLVVVGLAGVFVVRRIAEREAVNDAATLTDLLARTVVMPALDDALVDGDAAAAARFDGVVRSRILGATFVRVKVWTPQGRIVYSDAAALVGSTYALGEEEQAVLSAPATVAEVSDLSRPENRLERGQGRLLEVYRPVWTPTGRPLLFETYARYDTVTARTGDLWRGFGGIVVSSLLLFLVLLLPVLWTLLDRLRRAQEQRELLLRRAIDASDDERRRIAADLHDGVVQELVAASLVVAGAAERASGNGPGNGSGNGSGGDPAEADRLRSAAGVVRSSVGALRTLLVDIYPPNLRAAGVAAALADLGDGLRGRGVDVTVEVTPEAAAALDDERQRLVYRVARECLQNTAKHAHARTAELRLTCVGDRVVLEVGDDGVGLDAEVAAAAAADGHVGLRLAADLAAEHGAALHLETGSRPGTHWRLEIPGS